MSDSTSASLGNTTRGTNPSGTFIARSGKGILYAQGLFISSGGRTLPISPGEVYDDDIKSGD